MVLLVAASYLSGCATIVSKDTYPLNIASQPTQARYEIKNEDGTTIDQGTTPSTITLNASNGFFDGADYTITYTKDGFEPVTHTITSKVDGWYVGNILFGGFIGLLIVDPATGAMWKLPNSDMASMNSSSVSQLKVQSITSLSEEQRSHLVQL
ncbi:hypothetical protein J4N45_05020 [Vibrio sp. SCSIO 43140]|nr:hypothetical protein J4N45_05020 [Vibrio sp. SCSIO 43140]